LLNGDDRCRSNLLPVEAGMVLVKGGTRAFFRLFGRQRG